MLPGPEGAFQLSFATGGQTDDVLGVWQLAPTAGRDELSFAAGTPLQEEDATVWRVDLPLNTRQAANVLSHQRSALSQADLDLNQAQTRLQRFASVGPAERAGVSFAAPSGETGLSLPEAELAAWVGPPTGVASFAFGINLPQDWQQSAREALDFFAHVKQMLANYAYIESTSDGRMIGRTTVSWLGDFETLWRAGLSADQADLHRSSLELALQSRQAWIKMAMLVTQGAALLGLLTSTSNPLLIPAVYKFIKQVLAQYREIRRVQALPA